MSGIENIVKLIHSEHIELHQSNVLSLGEKLWGRGYKDPKIAELKKRVKEVWGL